MASTVLITGGNRGFGKALVEAYLSMPDTTVIATVRDVAHATPILTSLPVAAGSRLLITHMEMASAPTITSSVEALKTLHGITALDVVIANAALVGPTPRLAQAPTADLQTYVDVNAYGPFELAKAVLPLLHEAGPKAQFVYVSSAAGGLTNMRNTCKFGFY